MNKDLTNRLANVKMSLRFSKRKLFVVSLFLCLLAATAGITHLGQAQTNQISPDWTSITHDFFNLSPATTEPVITASMVTDRANVTFVADPFMIHVGSTWYMFFEVNENGNQSDSQIGLATSSDGLHWTYQQIVLDAGFHTAYPYVFEWNGTYYMIPETYSENAVKLYQATNFPDNWTFVENIVSGRSYVDSSIFRYNNTWWLFTSDESYNMWIYYSDNLTGPWQSNAMNPVLEGNTAAARGGGRVTVFDGNTIIRLAQNYTIAYGHEDDAYQVTTLTTTNFAETEIGPLIQASGSGWNADGMHTLDPWWIGDRWLAVVDGVNYSPSEVWSIGIYESPVVENSLTTSTNYGTVSPPSGMQDMGSNVTITATPPAAGTGERYVFLGWTGSGVGSYSGLDNPASVTMNYNITETASWEHEYYVTFAQSGVGSDFTGNVMSVDGVNYSSTGHSHWYDSGTSIPFSYYSPLVVTPNGEQYLLTGVSGNSTASSFTVTQGATITGAYKTQYYLTSTSAHGSPSPSSGWFDNGSSITGSVASPVSGGSGTQYVCTGWSGTGSVPASGSASAVTFTISAPSTITWNWKTQYYLTVSSAHGTAGGAGWYDSGTNVFATVTPLTVAGATGTQYVFTGWSGDASGTTSPSNAIIMNGPKTATANWKTQHYLTVDDGGHGTAGGQGWYDANTNASATMTPLTVAGTTGTQYVFAGWTGDTSGSGSPSDNITMNGPKTATANWITQYLVTFDQSGVASDFTGTVMIVNGTSYDRTGFTTWANASDVYTFSYVASPLVVTPNGEQYLLTGVSGNSTASSLTASEATTITGAYKTQYYLTTTSAHGTVGGSGWYDSGTNVFATVNPLTVAGATGTQYVFTGWSGDASGTTSPSNAITMDGPKTATANWQTQYYLTVNSDHGTAGGAGWYDSGTNVFATVNPLTVAGATGTQYVFTGWSGDASGTTSPSNAITMDGPKTATANWQTQYYLTVSSAYGTAGGAGWYDSGTSAQATTPLVVAGATGTQYVFTGWSGDASGTTSPSNAITMDGPKTATANWITQYLVTFDQSGVASDFTGTVMIVNGTSYDRTGFTTWANASDVYTFSYVASPLVVTPNGEQYLLTGVSGNSTASSLTASEATTITGAYKTQYYLTTTSLYDSPLPTNGWYDSGSSISAFVASPVSGDSGTQYVCTGWSGTGSVTNSGSTSAVTFTISAPSNITWNWKTQYLVSFVVSPSGDGTTSPSGTNIWQDAGSISISGTPSYNFKFSSWSADSGSITFGNSHAGSTTATVNGPGNITANFAELPAATPTPTPVPTVPTPTPTPSPNPTASPTPQPTNSSPTPTPIQSTNSLSIGIYIGGLVVAIVIVGVIVAIFVFRKRKP